MTKKSMIIVAVIVGILLIGGGAFAYNNSQNNKDETETIAVKEEASTNTTSPVKDETTAQPSTTTAPGSYITLAEYNANPTKYADSKKVYYFHASWCSICQAIDKEISADPSKLPSGVTMIKTDFDSSTQLRQKYGVTNQYTFVQVDNNGNETAQWSATNLNKAIAGIKS